MSSFLHVETNIYARIAGALPAAYLDCLRNPLRNSSFPALNRCRLTSFFFFFFFTIWVNEFSARLRVSIKLSLLAPSSTACLISVPCAACKLIDVSSIMDSHPYARIFEGTFCFHGPCRRCAVGNASGFARRASPVASGISEARARPPLNDHEHF